MIKGIPYYLWPSLELTRLRGTEFFPPIPDDCGALRTLCLGSKTRTIGDALVLTTIPGKLKARHPELKIFTLPRGFNRAVFYGNPHVSGVQYAPTAVYGDDMNSGGGHLIQLKEQGLGVPTSTLPRPEIFLTRDEMEWGKAKVGEGRRPLVLIHPWGHTWKRVLDIPGWETLISRWREKFRFWQLGVEGHDRITGCDEHFFVPPKTRYARQLFAVMRHARALVGVNSGPMHVARAFEVPSLILTEEGDLEAIFDLRRRFPYFLHGNHVHTFLYEENAHLDVPSSSPDGLRRAFDGFLEGVLE